MYIKGLRECFKDRYEYYNSEGKLHREDGPAIEFINQVYPGKFDRYFLNGIEIPKEQFKRKIEND